MASEELQKVTLNLYAEDIEFFEKRFGYGWSTEVRRIMHREVQAYQERDRYMDGLVHYRENDDYGNGP